MKKCFWYNKKKLGEKMIRIENIKIGKDLTKEELISDVCKKKGLDIN